MSFNEITLYIIFTIDHHSQTFLASAQKRCLVTGNMADLENILNDEDEQPFNVSSSRQKF